MGRLVFSRSVLSSEPKSVSSQADHYSPLQFGDVTFVTSFHLQLQFFHLLRESKKMSNHQAVS